MARIPGLIAITAFAGILGIGGGLAQGQENASNPWLPSAVWTRACSTSISETRIPQRGLDRRSPWMATSEVEAQIRGSLREHGRDRSEGERLGVDPLQADLLPQGRAPLGGWGYSIGCRARADRDLRQRPRGESGADELPRVSSSAVPGSARARNRLRTPSGCLFGEGRPGAGPPRAALRGIRAAQKVNQTAATVHRHPVASEGILD